MTNAQASKAIANFLFNNKSSDVNVISDKEGIESYTRFKLLRNELEGGTSELLIRMTTEDGNEDLEFSSRHLSNLEKSIEECIYEYLDVNVSGLESIIFGIV